MHTKKHLHYTFTKPIKHRHPHTHGLTYATTYTHKFIHKTHTNKQKETNKQR